MSKTQKVFKINNHKFAILLCHEAEINPWEFFSEGEVDFIIWPSYWGWNKNDLWRKSKQNNEPNLVFSNMKKWKVPLIQSNFAFNNLDKNTGMGPHGLSMFINNDNTLFSQGDNDSQSSNVITINNKKITECYKL